MQLNKFLFLCFFQIRHLLLTYFGVIFDFWGPNGLYLWLGKGSITVLGSTHVVEQISFSLFLSNPTFIFDLILGSFRLFGVPTGYNIGGWGRVQSLM